MKNIPKNLSAGLWYAQKDWPVLPLYGIKNGLCECGRKDCSSSGKHPRVKNGLHEATTDKDTINKWFTNWHNSNIGIRTGKESGFFVIDIDAKNFGEESFSDFISGHPKLPDTVESLTGGGGRHIFFKHPGFPVKGKVDFLPGVDIRGDGNYIVAPPSSHISGKNYEYEISSKPNETEIAPAPEWLLNFINERRDTSQDEKISEKIEGNITKGKRNSILTQIAGSMRRIGLGFEEINVTLQNVNTLRCNPPLERSEVENIVKSISRYHPQSDIIRDEIETIEYDWQLFSLKDVFKEHPPTEYIIQGFLPQKNFVIVFGAEGSLKSFILQDMAICVSSGINWLNPDRGIRLPSFKTIQTPVLWLDFDMGFRRVIMRFKSLANFYKSDSETPLYFYSMPTPPLDCMNFEDIQMLKDRITSIEIHLIIVDNLAVIHPSINENDAQMAQVMFHLRWLVEETGASIILIHHQTKNAKVSRLSDRLRGHSSIIASCDLALHCVRDSDDPVIKLRATKNRDAEIEEIAAKFLYDSDPKSRDLKEACFVRVPYDGKIPDSVIQTTIKEIIKSNPEINNTQLRAKTKEMLKIGDPVIRKIISEMEEKEEVQIKRGGRNAKIYSI